jgi:hypothetical protein
MNETQRQRLIAEDAEERYGIFADIVIGMTKVPEMPAELAPFDNLITRDQVEREADAIFLIWLRGKLDGVSASMAMDDPLPCSDADLIESFFPEWPDPSDFEDGSRSGEFMQLQGEADIDAAIAKRACEGCPLRIQCLARALHVDAEYPRGADPESDGVFGGWGPGARETIHNKLMEKRRLYTRGIQEDSWGVVISARKGMSEPLRAELENKARALVVR